jgi:hypothetical protein
LLQHGSTIEEKLLVGQAKNYSIYCVRHKSDGRAIRNAGDWKGPGASRVAAEGLFTEILDRGLRHEECRLGNGAGSTPFEFLIEEFHHGI